MQRVCNKPLLVDDLSARGIGVSDEDRKLAFANIRKAAKHYGVDMSEDDWKELGRHPSTGRTAEDRSKSAQKAAATRKAREHHQQHK